MAEPIEIEHGPTLRDIVHSETGAVPGRRAARLIKRGFLKSFLLRPKIGEARMRVPASEQKPEQHPLVPAPLMQPKAFRSVIR
jgi:hypothetical protein